MPKKKYVCLYFDRKFYIEIGIDPPFEFEDVEMTEKEFYRLIKLLKK